MNEKQTIKTTVIEVAGLLSALSARGVEKRLRGMPGVEQAEVNYVAGSANVTYDKTRTDLEAIKGRVEECGYRCAGELLPRHVFQADGQPREALAAVPAAEFHRGHTDHAEHAAAEVEAADMAHGMGHGGGMDMQAIVRDMRNRFWICLVFTVPIFIYSPMGELFTPPPPPFGLELNLWLFLLGTVAVIWPSWPFFVAAWRALKNGVLNMAVLVVLSVGTGYLFSLGATFVFDGVQFFEAVAVLLVFILLGHWLEMRARAGASHARLDGRVWTTDKDGIVPALLAAEITARLERDPGEQYRNLAQILGESIYRRVEAPASQRQKAMLARLTAQRVDATELAGERISSILDRAPGNGAPIGGVKVSTRNGWFAARPSGTEALYKIYAESFRDMNHLQRIIDHARHIVGEALATPTPEAT